MATIEIWDGASVRLRDLLDRVPIADELNWAVLEIWAVAQDDDIDVVVLERQADESPNGIVMTAVELRRLAHQLHQFIDGIVVGYRDQPPKHSDADLRDTAEVVIEAIDSTQWRIYARDEVIVEGLRRDFQDVRDIAPEGAVAATHGES